MYLVGGLIDGSIPHYLVYVIYVCVYSLPAVHREGQEGEKHGRGGGELVATAVPVAGLDDQQALFIMCFVYLYYVCIFVHICVCLIFLVEVVCICVCISMYILPPICTPVCIVHTHKPTHTSRNTHSSRLPRPTSKLW